MECQCNKHPQKSKGVGTHAPVLEKKVELCFSQDFPLSFTGRGPAKLGIVPQAAD